MQWLHSSMHPGEYHSQGRAAILAKLGFAHRNNGTDQAVRRGRQQDPLAQLTEQEQRILELIAEGDTNKEIAREVNLSDKTVKNYVSNILGKLEMSRRSQAAAYMADRRARRDLPP